jgi:hypothetical protein
MLPYRKPFRRCWAEKMSVPAVLFLYRPSAPMARISTRTATPWFPMELSQPMDRFCLSLPWTLRLSCNCSAACSFCVCIRPNGFRNPSCKIYCSGCIPDFRFMPDRPSKLPNSLPWSRKPDISPAPHWPWTRCTNSTTAAWLWKHLPIPGPAQPGFCWIPSSGFTA